MAKSELAKRAGELVHNYLHYEEDRKSYHRYEVLTSYKGIPGPIYDPIYRIFKVYEFYVDPKV